MKPSCRPLTRPDNHPTRGVNGSGGSPDSLGALGLVLNAVVLWNTRYTDAALAALRAQGYPVRDADAARLSPLGDAHLNVHGRYTFAATTGEGLRPLRDPSEPADEDVA